MPNPKGLPLATRDRIVELVADGLRFVDVAAELGITKGQVAGVVHRIAISQGHVVRPRGTEKPGDRSRVKKRRETRSPKAAPVPEPVATVPWGPAGGPSKPNPVPSVATDQHRRGETGRARISASIPPARTCQWIEGEPSADDACKCGAPSFPGFSYCEPHLARAYQPTRKAKTDGEETTSIEEWKRARKRHLDALTGW